MPTLQVLSLSLNQLSGSVPISLFCISYLRRVLLGFNAFTGISMSQSGEQYVIILEFLDLQVNHIAHASFPLWLTNATSLKILDLSGNSFSGALPLGNCFINVCRSNLLCILVICTFPFWSLWCVDGLDSLHGSSYSSWLCQITIKERSFVVLVLPIDLPAKLSLP
ncbi:hypothetical protein RJT34_06500 [Clitoria ternatea]|uniref:Uncharacterized protein n=1 Tax=Clitoria ternatea TaxID=43366 RepID=A0AAN9PUC4_CLITE